MPRLFDRISFAFLTLIYLAATSGTLFGHSHHPVHRSGPVILSKSAQTDGSPGKRTWSQRRHLPLVRDISLLPGLLPFDAGSWDPVQVSPVLGPPEGIHPGSPHHPAFSDRAPPRS